VPSYALEALLLAAMGLTCAWLAGSLVARPVNHAVPAPPPPARPVRLITDDHVPIAGSYWPGAARDAPAVLLLHGINNDRRIFDRQIAWLNGLGYAVLAIDMRGHGESGAAERTFGWREAGDAAAALRWLRAADPKRKVGVIGVSLGGAAALLGEDGPLPADVMILHAVYPDIRTAIRNRLERVASPFLARLAEPLLGDQSWLRYGVSPDRISPREGLGRYRGSVLIIGGTADRDTRVADSRAMYAAARGPKQLWLLSGLDHVATSKLWTPQYRARVGALLEHTLGRPSPPRPRAGRRGSVPA
jgi:dipeptidyl aminopeptidase/acylaminoacyl peptidase